MHHVCYFSKYLKYISTMHGSLDNRHQTPAALTDQSCMACVNTVNTCLYRRGKSFYFFNASYSVHFCELPHVRYLYIGCSQTAQWQILLVHITCMVCMCAAFKTYSSYGHTNPGGDFWSLPFWADVQQCVSIFHLIGFSLALSFLHLLLKTTLDTMCHSCS